MKSGRFDFIVASSMVSYFNRHTVRVFYSGHRLQKRIMHTRTSTAKVHVFDVPVFMAVVCLVPVAGIQ